MISQYQHSMIVQNAADSNKYSTYGICSRFVVIYTRQTEDVIEASISYCQNYLRECDMRETYQLACKIPGSPPVPLFALR